MPDAALHDDQALVLEALVGFGDGERVRLLFSSKRAHRRQRVAIAEFTGEDCIGDRLAKADVYGLVVLGPKRHGVIIQRIA